MRIVAVSDTHGLHNGIEDLPAGDVLVHAGDFMKFGFNRKDVLSFNDWLGEQPFKHRVVCAGNHDRYFEKFPQDARSLLINATYLEGSCATINGATFWGSPYTPDFLDWAFMYPRGSGAKYWDQIPCGLDVLITHGPPFGILDQIRPCGEHLGCAELLASVEQNKPRFICSAIFTEVQEALRAELPAS